MVAYPTSNRHFKVIHVFQVTASNSTNLGLMELAACFNLIRNFLHPNDIWTQHKVVKAHPIYTGSFCIEIIFFLGLLEDGTQSYLTPNSMSYFQNQRWVDFAKHLHCSWATNDIKSFINQVSSYWSFKFLVFETRVLLCSPGWPELAILLLALQVYIIVPTPPLNHSPHDRVH
jgi:hypothetical protein